MRRVERREIVRAVEPISQCGEVDDVEIEFLLGSTSYFLRVCVFRENGKKKNCVIKDWLYGAESEKFSKIEYRSKQARVHLGSLMRILLEGRCNGSRVCVPFQHARAPSMSLPSSREVSYEVKTAYAMAMWCPARSLGR